jgi:hypothetical protein
VAVWAEQQAELGADQVGFIQLCAQATAQSACDRQTHLQVPAADEVDAGGPGPIDQDTMHVPAIRVVMHRHDGVLPIHQRPAEWVEPCCLLQSTAERKMPGSFLAFSSSASELSSQCSSVPYLWGQE